MSVTNLKDYLLNKVELIKQKIQYQAYLYQYECLERQAQRTLASVHHEISELDNDNRFNSQDLRWGPNLHGTARAVGGAIDINAKHIIDIFRPRLTAEIVEKSVQLNRLQNELNNIHKVKALIIEEINRLTNSVELDESKTIESAASRNTIESLIEVHFTLCEEIMKMEACDSKYDVNQIEELSDHEQAYSMLKKQFLHYQTIIEEILLTKLLNFISRLEKIDKAIKAGLAAFPPLALSPSIATIIFANNTNDEMSLNALINLYETIQIACLDDPALTKAFELTSTREDSDLTINISSYCYEAYNKAYPPLISPLARSTFFTLPRMPAEDTVLALIKQQLTNNNTVGPEESKHTNYSKKK